MIKQGQKINLYLPKLTKQKLFSLATHSGRSMSSIVSELVAEKSKVLESQRRGA